MFYKVLLYTNICVRYVIKIVLKYQVQPCDSSDFTFNPLFDANILNDVISSFIL